jgi:Flp pilus assembly protein TadG
MARKSFTSCSAISRPRGIKRRKKNMNRLKRRSSGQIAVILTMSLVVLLGAMALGADEAVMYFNWVQLQKAADAAALAGAMGGLPYDPTTAQSTATTYAQDNGMVRDGDTITPTVAADDKSITVTVGRTVPYVFGKVLGLTSHPVLATATAAIMNSEGACGFLPIGLPCDVTTPVKDATQCGDSSYVTYENGGGQLTLKASQVGPGNWEPLAINANGGSAYQNEITYGYAGAPIVPGASAASVSTETGDIVGPTRHGFEARMSNAGASSWIETPPSVIDATMWQAVLVPLVNFTGNDGSGSGSGGGNGWGGGVNGKKTVPIVGFQEMWITGVDGNNATITGYMVNNLPNCGAPTAGAGTGPTTVALIH